MEEHQLVDVAEVIRASDDGSDQDSLVEEEREGRDPEGPIIALLSQRIQRKKKRLREIRRLEKKVQDGEEISAKQKKRIGRKDELTVEVKELENLKMLLPKAIADELSYKIPKNSPTPTDTSETELESEGTEADETSEDKNLAAAGNGHAQGESGPKTGKRFYSFLRRYKLEGDDKIFYYGDAMALVSRRSFRVQYSDLCAHDKALAMEICADFESLMPSLREAAKRFCGEILKKTIKGLTPQKANAVIANLESLKLTITAKPRSHQMLNIVLQPPNAVLADVETHSDKEKLMQTTSDLGSSVLMGTLQALVSKHMEGLSFNGKFGIGDVEVFNGDTYVISSQSVKHAPGSKPWAESCQLDFKCYSDSFIPIFKIGEIYPPYMAELKAALATVSLNVLQSFDACMAFHKFVLDHMAGKPPLVRAALLAGIHNCCKSFDPDDPEAPYKTIIHDLEGDIPGLGIWTDKVKQCDNQLMKQFLSTKTRKGRVIPCKYLDDLESMTEYLRVLHEHGSDYTKDRKKKNQGKRRKKRKNSNTNQQGPNTAPNQLAPNQQQAPNQRAPNQQQAPNQQSPNQQSQNQQSPNQQSQNQQSPNQQSQNQQGQNLNPNLNVLDEDERQLQRLKKLDELEMIGARHLGPFVLELIYALLKKKAMTGMMLTVWKAYRSCKVSHAGSR